ncbi:chromatin-binding/pre-rRNA-processing protein IPI3 [Sporobolomyces koalae]|uniref:chromatin-binding/pre-rRNA-processing protein IPI3 n=1 Tax=Sporobolomyces koalae TaxID=500713 RepID=UPI003178B2FB
MASLSEVVISSTSAAAPLPLTSIHSVHTGQTVFSFKSPAPPSTTTTSSLKGKQVDEGSNELAQTMSYVPGGNGVASLLLGLGGKDGRALLNVWNTTRESTVARLIPPVRLNTLATSRDGSYLVGGTSDGRVFLWEIATGILLATLDAHYRAISCLEFTSDGAALITASEDAGVSVWSLGRILNSTPMNPPTPFTTLSDHTLGITRVAVGLGSFPNSRVFTASKDGTVKIWDLSTSPATLLSTFQFPAPVLHLAVDPLERFFFVSVPHTTSTTSASTSTTTETAGSRVIRVNLFREKKDSFGIATVEAIGGTGSMGELERINGDSSEPGVTYTLTEPISALHLSAHSPTLLVSTAQSSQIHILSLPSLLPTRIISPPPSSTPYGGLTFLTTTLHPGSMLGGDASTAYVQREVASQLGRSVVGVEERERGGRNGRSVTSRVYESLAVENLIQPVRGLDSLPLYGNGGIDAQGAVSGAAGTGPGGGDGGDRERIERLEREIVALRKGLGKAKGINERIWKQVVNDTMTG